MKKSKLLFKATLKRPIYRSLGERLKDNDTAIFDEPTANRLLKAFPDNFFLVETFTRPDNILDIFIAPEGFLPIQGLYVTKRTKRLNVDFEKE